MMHHGCTNYGGNMTGSCTCGILHGNAPPSSFSMMFSSPGDHHKPYDVEDESMVNHFVSPSSSVDCTLSLGTPSTRLSGDQQDDERMHHSSSLLRNSNFGCWNFLQMRNSYTNGGYQSQKGNGSGRGSSHSHSSSCGGGIGNTQVNGDPLLARRCANCDTTSTPLWRNGPRGPKSLCNACGIRYKKEERRATANSKGAGASGLMDNHYAYHNNSWVPSPKLPCYSPAANEFKFMDDEADGDNLSFLSWRLNVADRPSLVHDFTR